ncbi:MAG: TerB family tellurite resistance protein [Pricia sp.]
MNSYQEKLSILSEMIAFAKVDGTVKAPEYNFLSEVADHIGVNQQDFEELFTTKTEHVVPKSEADRIVQFHRLVLLMNVDQVQTDKEIARLKNVGLGMGLRPTAIDQVLSVMDDYPNKVVPPQVLINIFKAHYN